MNSQIVNVILEIAPSVITILTVIGVIIKVIGQFTSLKKQFEGMKETDKKEIQELRDQMSIVIQENYELKKTLNETMTKIDGIRRE